jgi:hypothetical protein
MPLNDTSGSAPALQQPSQQSDFKLFNKATLPFCTEF